MIASCTASCLFILLITAEFIYAESLTALSVPKPVTFENAAVRIPVAAVSDGDLHRFVIEDQGVHVRFIIIEKPDRTLAVALDACQICGNPGLLPERPRSHLPQLRLRYRNIKHRHPGSCNPIPLESHIDGDTLVINEDAFERGVRVFRNV